LNITDYAVHRNTQFPNYKLSFIQIFTTAYFKRMEEVIGIIWFLFSAH